MTKITEKIIHETGLFIKKNQLSNGAIPWEKGRHMDPWNQTEASMGLTTLGYYKESLQAFETLASIQNDNGSWYSKYNDELTPLSTTSESNFNAYIATGLWHFYRKTKNIDILNKFWNCIHEAIEFTLSYQSNTGDVAWAIDLETNTPLDDALLTGNASIYKSLLSAISIQQLLQKKTKSDWSAAATQLKHCILYSPQQFDRNWASKSHYAMDWFYPILSNIFTQKEGLERIKARWDEFVINPLGCRCVTTEPWITVAETCELILTLTALQQYDIAFELFEALFFYRDNASFGWETGYQYKEHIFWPTEQTTWTAGAVILAWDALHQKTENHNFFSIDI